MEEPHRAVVDSTAIVGDRAALARRAKHDGYLFFRGLVPRPVILGLRRRFLEIAAAADWLTRDEPLGMRVLEPLAGRWVSGDLAAGDVVIFHSLTVHKALSNRSAQLRVILNTLFAKG